VGRGETRAQEHGRRGAGIAEIMLCRGTLINQRSSAKSWKGNEEIFAGHITRFRNFRYLLSGKPPMDWGNTLTNFGMLPQLLLKL
jgi:hypothetical protein